MGMTVERISRTEVVGLGGEGWPTSPLAFARDAAAAMGLPALGVALGAPLVWGFSEVLLHADETPRLILFSVVPLLVPLL